MVKKILHLRCHHDDNMKLLFVYFDQYFLQPNLEFIYFFVDLEIHFILCLKILKSSGSFT